MNPSSDRPNDDATTSAPIGEGFAKPAGKPAPLAARWLALGAVVGPVLFAIAWLVLGPLRPGYSFVSRPISALAIGPNGVLMRAVFLLNGLLVIVGVIAVFQSFKHTLGTIARWSCMVLLLLSPLGILWAGIFTMDTLALHNLGAYSAFGTPIITFPIVGLVLRRVPGWRCLGTWMLLGCPLTLALLVGFTTSVPHSELVTGIGGGTYGLWQRALIAEVQAWFVALGALAFRRS
jgi:hypothetical membrane protein